LTRQRRPRAIKIGGSLRSGLEVVAVVVVVAVDHVEVVVDGGIGLVRGN
jgi:hypothetical protein